MPELLARRGDLLAVQGRCQTVAMRTSTTPWRPSWAGRRPTVPGRSDAELFDAPLATALRAAEQTALAQARRWPANTASNGPARGTTSRCCAWLSPADAAGRRWLCSVWTDLAPAAPERRAVARRAGTDRAAAAGQRTAAPRTRRPGAARPRLGPVPPRRTSKTSCAARSTCPRASTANSRSSSSSSTRSPSKVLALGAPAEALPARGHGPAAARQHARDGRILPLRRPALRACCCRAWAWPPRIRAWKACAASARRRSWCTTARSWASPCRWAWPAFRTRRTSQAGPGGGLRGRAGRGAAPRRQPRHAGGIRFEAELSASSAAGQAQPDQALYSIVAARPSSITAKQALELPHVDALRRARAQRRQADAGHAPRSASAGR